MAYTPLDESLPDGATQNGPAVFPSVRDNQKALRDAILAGALVGWNTAPSGGTAEEPAVMTRSKGAERVKSTLTWSAGLVTTVVHAYSSNSGSSWDTIGTLTITYDANDNFTGATWS